MTSTSRDNSRRIAGAVLAACLALPAGGCRPPAERRATATAGDGFPVVLSDDSGRQVAIQSRPRRIISLSPGHTETLFDLGAGDRLVAADTYSLRPAAARPLAKLNCWPRPPVESMVALRPDLVLCLTEPDEFLRQMDDLGIPALKLFPTGVDGAMEAIRAIGTAVGEEPAARALTREMARRLERLRNGVAGQPQPRVLLELDGVDTMRPFVAGSRGLYGDVLRLAGGRNIFEDVAEPAQQVSAEQILTRDPEVILLADANSPIQPQTPEKVRARVGWSRVSAVRSGRVFVVDADALTRPCRRLVDAAEEIAGALRREPAPAPEPADSP